MTFLDRPVFEFVLDWKTSPTRSFTYDLRSVKAGFGWPRFAATDLHVVNGFEFSLWLRDEEEIEALDQFFDSLRGPLAGFWIPAAQVWARIADGVAATTFDVEDAGLRNSWSNHPDQYLTFEKDGEERLAAKVTAIALVGDHERVTIDTSLSIDETWTVRVLHYVRLAGDSESGTYEAEGRMRRQLRLVELPTEYAETETGRAPVYLYHFSADFGGVVTHWRFTSYWTDLASNGETFTATAITHGSLARSSKADRESVKLSAFYEAGNPLALFVPFTLPVTLAIEILEATFADLDAAAVVFTGQVQGVRLTGKKLDADCSSLLDALDRKVPRMILGPRCPYQLFDVATCKLTRASFEQAGLIEAITGTVVRVHTLPVDRATSYFSFGWIETGTGPDFEIRTILSDTRIDADTHDLTFNLALNNAALGQAITVLPGDDHRAETCSTKFANLVNFGGQPFIPQNNLTLQAIQAQPAAGGKK